MPEMPPAVGTNLGMELAADRSKRRRLGRGEMLHDHVIGYQARSICALFVGLLSPSVALGAIRWPASC
jgi:hypothetical protein